MFNTIKDFLRIYTWRELWEVIGIATGILMIWFLFCFLLTIPIIPLRAFLIWTLIFILHAFSPDMTWKEAIERKDRH